MVLIICVEIVIKCVYLTVFCVAGLVVISMATYDASNYSDLFIE